MIGAFIIPYLEHVKATSLLFLTTVTLFGHIRLSKAYRIALRIPRPASKDLSNPAPRPVLAQGPQKWIGIETGTRFLVHVIS